MSSIVKAGRIQKQPMFQLKSKGTKRSTSQLKGSQTGGIPSYSWEGQLFGPIQALN